MFYCWRWVYKQGIKQIEQITAELVVHGEEIKQIDILESTRILGVHITLSLNWKSQFEVMRRKMDSSVSKLVCISINPFQAAIYYNAYMIKSVYFGYGIVEL